MKKKMTTAAEQQLRPTNAQPDEFRLIPRVELHPDPDQPRKTFDEASLKELAESIREQGIVQPLIVRQVKARYRLIEPNLVSKQWHVEEWLPPQNGDAGAWAHAFQHDDEKACRSFAGELNLKDRFVIVAGERRWRASDLVGLNELPCIVRDVDEARKFAQQIIENNQREGVSAIEEARALEREYQRRREGLPTLKKEDFARELGMSRADFYGTLVLTRLHPPVEKALLAGKISPSQAKVIAMVPLPNQQEKVLEHIAEELETYGNALSVRDLQEHVEEEHVKQLKEAPFKLDELFAWDSKFPMEVRDTAPINATPQVLPCEACPFRTGNMLEAFPELKSRPNACTRPDCFAQKCKVFWQQEAVRKQQAGKTVMTPKEFKAVSKDYVKGDLQVSAQNLCWGDTMEKAMGKHKPEPVLVATAKGLEKYYPKEEAIQAAKKNGTKFYDRQQEKLETPEQKIAREAKEQAAAEKSARAAAFAIGMIPRIAKAFDGLKDKAAWELLDKDRDSWNKTKKQLILAAKTSKACVLIDRLWYDLDGLFEGHGNDEDAVKILKVAGIDFKAEFAAEEKQAQAALALPAKKTAEQGKLLDTKPNRKKDKKK